MNSYSYATDGTDLHLLDPSVTSLMMQFVFRDRSLVSSYLYTGERERVRPENDLRTGPGIKLILPTLYVGTKAFLMELEDAGWTMMDADCEERADGQKAARFIFGRAPVIIPVQHFKDFLAEHALPSLQRLCSEAMWQLCAFRNPRKDGVGISINCNARLSYNKDAQKPVAPHYFLRIINNKVVLD